MERAPKVYLARALLLLVSLSLVFAVGEIWVRLALPDTDPIRSATPDEVRGLPLLKTMHELRQPNVRGRHVNQVHRTNSFGLRGPEWAREAAPGTTRIGVGGDSVTMGWGVEESDRYSDQLERALDGSAGEASTEVVNTGLAGLNAIQGVRRLLRFDDVYGFDLLVYGFTPNDVEGPDYVHLGPEGGHAGRFKRLTRARTSPSRLWRRVWPGLITFYEQIAPWEQTLEEELAYNILENERA